MPRPLFQVKQLFFDRPKVRKAVDQGTRRVLSRFGAFVRTKARDLTKKRPAKRQRTSDPGQPPRRHTGVLRRLIFFAYEPERRTVVIGPAKIHGSPDSPTIPEVLEHGGRTKLSSGARARIAARPYMGPAMRDELPKLPQMWRDSVR